MDRRVRTIVDRAVKGFKTDLGCEVTIEPTPIGDFIDCFRAIVALETDLSGLRALSSGREGELSPSVRELLAKPWAAASFTDAVTQRKAAVNAMARFMARFDLLLTPTAPVLPFPVDLAGPGAIEGSAGSRRCVDAGALSRKLDRAARSERASRLDGRRPSGRSADHRPSSCGSHGPGRGRCLRSQSTVEGQNAAALSLKGRVYAVGDPQARWGSAMGPRSIARRPNRPRYSARSSRHGGAL